MSCFAGPAMTAWCVYVSAEPGHERGGGGQQQRCRFGDWRLHATLQRRVLQLRLQGHSVDPTAAKAGCSERSVHRVLQLVRTRLEQRLLEETMCE
jgi:hypothetical protein